MVASDGQYDAMLDGRVRADIARLRRKRSIFAFLSIMVILTEVTLGVLILVAVMRDASGTDAIIISSISTVLLTIDVSFSIRERAAAHHSTLTQLVGIRNRMRYPQSSPLWQDYHSIKAFDKINYIEAMCDCFSWTVPVPDPRPLPPELP